MKIYKIYRNKLLYYIAVEITYLIISSFLIYLFIPILSKYDFDFKAFIGTVISFSICAFLGLYPLFLYIIYYKYDKSTIIKYNNNNNDVEYYNKYSGVIKFNIKDIIQCTSYRIPNILISYLEIELNNGKKIYITCFISYDICLKNKNLKHEVITNLCPKIILKRVMGGSVSN